MMILDHVQQPIPCIVCHQRYDIPIWMSNKAHTLAVSSLASTFCTTVSSTRALIAACSPALLSAVVIIALLKI
jgi:hypothetical protein